MTINISFPGDLYVFIRERTEGGAYASISEYLRDLVREDRERILSGKRPRPLKRPGLRKANDYMAGMPD